MLYSVCSVVIALFSRSVPNVQFMIVVNVITTFAQMATLYILNVALYWTTLFFYDVIKYGAPLRHFRLYVITSGTGSNEIGLPPSNGMYIL